ncbi:hypothetical protein GE061_005147 [Apolygus lucorum]|uniref:Uncharacterized protein n=1 Tax=Apolygus lucorum TaxID=248454 RepID=A0A6A4IVY0_APOLU|nr:hypothetical protein GE061_005147 [Apolygus lucorum]
MIRSTSDFCPDQILIHDLLRESCEDKMKSAQMICLFLGFVAFIAASPVEDISWEQPDNVAEDPDWVPAEIDESDDTWGDDEFVNPADYADEDERGIFSNSKGKNRCSCISGNSCGCCASPRIPIVGKIPACLNVTINPKEQNMVLNVEVKGKTLVNKQFSTAKTERICDRVPESLGVKSIKVCLNTDTTELADNSGIQSCLKIDVLKDEKIYGKIQFACAQFKDGQLSLNDAGDVKAKDFFKISSGNPIKGILNLLGLREPSKKD